MPSKQSTQHCACDNNFSARFTPINQENAVHHVSSNSEDQTHAQDAPHLANPSSKPNITSRSNPRDLSVLLSGFEVNTADYRTPIPEETVFTAMMMASTQAPKSNAIVVDNAPSATYLTRVSKLAPTTDV